MKRLPLSAALLVLLVGLGFVLSRENLAHRSLRGGETERRSPANSLSPTGSDENQISTISNSLLSRRNQARARNLPITAEFVRSLAKGPSAVSFALPDGQIARGVIEQRHRAADGSPVGVTGRVDTPHPGTFFFQVQPDGAASGPVVGAVVFKSQDLALRVLAGPDQTSLLSEMAIDQVICRNTTLPPQAIEAPQAIPAEHPNFPIPGYQNGIAPLQSRPAALGVLYLDYDGQLGPHQGWWQNFNAAAPTVNNAQIREVWARVSEDFAPFNLNVTTDLQVYLNAPETSRQRCIVTPTDVLAPNSGGLAFVGSFGWNGDIPCWAFITSGKNAAEVISHELGHTLGLSHDGRATTPTPEDYYLGHGTDPVGWAPIMGQGYSKNLTQWSKGEYALANQTQDDLAIIAGNTNVGYRPDDVGGTHATAALLDIFNNGTVDSEGTIETRTDVDAFRFTVGNGNLSLQINPVSPGPNLDISASIFNSTGNSIAVSNPDTSTTASFFISGLAAGEYTLRIDGTGRGDPNTTGYTDYGSLGQYTITGTVFGAVGPDRFAVAENVPAGTLVGTPTLRRDHAGAALAYSISAGNTSSAFAIHPTTGAITVNSPAVLNFEALSSSWTTPPTFDLTVNVINSINPSLNETLRVVVSITNVNEAPTLMSPGPLTAVSRTVPGTVLGTVTATDPDTYDLPLFSIVSGNPDGKFSITPAGVITVGGGLIVSTPTTYLLGIRGTDQGTPPMTSDITVPVTMIPAPSHLTPGIVTQNIHENIAGSMVSDLTSHPSFPGQPTRKVQLTDFTATNQGTNYGSTVRSWIVAPITGTYRFWISANTTADLFFSAAGNPLAATRIAYLNAPSNFQQWTAYGIQQSSTFNLTAGQLCYIEARHKVDSGDDHLSVAWEIKDPANSATLTPRSVIPSRYLAPHLFNYPPYFLASPSTLGTVPAGSLISQSLAPLVGDLENSVTFSLVSGPSWISLNSAGILSGTPTTQDIGTFVLTVAINDGQNPNVQGTVTLTVIAPQNIALPSLTINPGETSVFADGTASYTNLVNNGVLRLQDPADLNITGTFTNTGVIDTIHWSGTLPPNLINTGTILDRSAIRVSSTEISPTHFTLSVPGFQGHFYQLQGTQNFTDPWTFIGDAVPGTGSAPSPPALQFTAPLDGPAKFFRVVVTPAP
jgi:hypothetical protein